MDTKIIISLCDHSGNWSRPFAERGYMVICVDPKHPCVFGRFSVMGRYSGEPGDGGGLQLAYQGTVADFLADPYVDARLQYHGGNVVGIIAQPVCTQFSGAGARHWAKKDEENPGLLLEALRLVDDCMGVVHKYQPYWWVLENPVGRLGRLYMGKPVMTFQPHEYAGWAKDPDSEAYTKRTCLWGRFNDQILKAAKRDVGNKLGSIMWARYGSASAATKERRSVTPTGFAEAFAWSHA